MPIKGVELEVTDGITEHSSRVALKGVFQNFGDVVSCWVPPVDRRGLDAASVRFANTQAAEAAKNACDAGQVFLQGLPVKVAWRTAGGRRVGNSDLGITAGGNSPSPARSKQLALMDVRGGGERDRRERDRAPRSGREEKRRSRSRRRRSRSRRRRSREGRRLSTSPPKARKSRSPKKSKTKPKESSLSRERPVEEPEPKVAPPKQETTTLAPPPGPPPPGAFTGVAPAGLPPVVPAPVLSISAPGLNLGSLQIESLMADASLLRVPLVDPVAEKRKLEELKAARAERAKQLKRGPGVAALVQGALKRAQEAPAVKKEEFVASERNEKTRRQEEILLKDVKLDEPESDNEEEKRQKEEEEAAKQKQAEAEKKQQEEQAKQKEAAEKEARERRAKAEAAEAEKALQKEAETRDKRVKASVEAAKKQQAERAAAKAAKEAESLYADMPQPNTDDAAAAEAAMKEAAAAQKAANLHLPAEDKSKVVFLDVDGVLRPARAGTFDMSTDGEAAAKPDTSDFFPEAMKALRHILERTSATIVLCSEWRRSETLLSALSTAFDKNRLRAWSSITTTALKLQTGPEPLRCFAERRAREISEWLQAHEGDVNGWVVLDDINLTIADEARKTTTKAMGPHHVQPMPLCGLTMGNAKIAVRILNGAMINKVVVERPVAPTGGIATGSGSRGRL